MFNDWFSIGPFTVHGYGVMIAIGILVGFYIAEKLADKNGLSKEHVDNLVFTVLITGYLVSKLTYVLVNFSDFLKNPMAVLGSSGWVVMGGLIGGILGAYGYCKIKKIDFFAYFNLFMPEVALAQAFGRIGCFFAGCCYGLETDSHLSLVFPKGSLAPFNCLTLVNCFIQESSSVIPKGKLCSSKYIQAFLSLCSFAYVSHAF